MTVPARSKAVSAPPFLVNAVLEALQRSSYSHLTSVVPAEADAFCAEAARHRNATIFTSDSDLLVHDLGESGKVMLFRDMEAIHVANKGLVIKTSEYHPARIASRLELPSLVKLAYLMTEDVHRSFTDSIGLARTQIPSGPEYLDFERLYGALISHSPLLASASDLSHDAGALLSALDPRTSEIVHQLHLPPSNSIAKVSRSIDGYLPFIHDDPTKTSAWRAGASIRQISYSILHLLDPTITTICEHERKGTRIGTTDITIQEADSLATSIQDLISRMSSLFHQHTSLSPETAWRILSAEIIYEHSYQNSKPLPRITEMVPLILNERETSLTWTLIHSTAQLHGLLYSFRMLKQILELTLSLLPDIQSQDQHLVSKETEGIIDLLPSLKHTMASLPNLCDMLEPILEDEIRDETRNTVWESLARYEPQREDEGTLETKGKRKKKKRKKDGDIDGGRSTRGVGQTYHGTNNAFAALADDV